MLYFYHHLQEVDNYVDCGDPVRPFSFEHDFAERDGCEKTALVVLWIPLPERTLRHP